VFLISNAQSIFWPFGTVPKSLTGSVSVRRGPLAAVVLGASSATANGAATMRASASVMEKSRFDMRRILL
jgi:hypothetical protein